jgi:hypothetical protein
MLLGAAATQEILNKLPFIVNLQRKSQASQTFANNTLTMTVSGRCQVRPTKPHSATL